MIFLWLRGFPNYRNFFQGDEFSDVLLSDDAEAEIPILKAEVPQARNQRRNTSIPNLTSPSQFLLPVSFPAIASVLWCYFDEFDRFVSPYRVWLV